MHAEKLGSEIKKIRVMRGLTQKQLSDNICHQSEVSRNEWVRYTQVWIYCKVSQQNYKFLLFIFMRYSFIPILKEKNSLIDQIIMLCKQKKYKEIYNKVWNELKRKNIILNSSNFFNGNIM